MFSRKFKSYTRGPDGEAMREMLQKITAPASIKNNRRLLEEDILRATACEAKDLKKALRTIPDYLFHTTPTSNLKGIAERGLIPYRSVRGQKGVFLAEAPGVVEWALWAQTSIGIGSVETVPVTTLRVRTADLQLDKLKIDINGSDDALCAWAYKTKIKPENIQVWAGRKWRPL